jgi:hypothetical protein
MVPSTRPSSDEMLCWASPPWAKSIRKAWVRGGAGVKFLLENYAVPTSGENNGDSPVCPRIVHKHTGSMSGDRRGLPLSPHCPSLSGLGILGNSYPKIPFLTAYPMQAQVFRAA